MSRCFPYPPPGYAGKCASNEALIWTIKLQRESEKPNSEKKKDRRKEKKEKKRDDKTNGTITSSEKKEKKIEDKSNGNISMGKKTLTDEKLHHGVKQQETSNENMEKSTLTEEHGRPCSSSDSTENSGKRKRQSPPPAGNNPPRNPGTVIRLVLNSRKKESCPTSSICAAPSSTIISQKANVAAVVNSSAKNLHITPPKSNNVSMASVFRKADAMIKNSDPKVYIAPPKSNATQLIISSSNKDKDASCPVAKGIEQKTSLPKEEKLPRPLRKYKALFESWVPSAMEIDTVNGGDDEDWLFGSKKECNSDERMKCCKEEVPSYDKPAYQPIAHFLSDADIYALPFTVPF